MDNNMTVISQGMFDKAVSAGLSVDRAVEMLRSCTQFRTLSSRLQSFAKGRDLRKLLFEGLVKNHPESKPEAIDRKIRNWLSDRQDSVSKETAIELCFILGLDFEESDALVAGLSEERLHWRSPEELPYIFALYKGLSYESARMTDEKIKSLTSGKKPGGEGGETFTSLVYEQVQKLRNEEELIEYVISSYDRLGQNHNTAYELFCRMMDKLESVDSYNEDGEDYFPENERYSVGKILRTYMHKDEVPELTGKDKKSFYSALQRSIAKSWPDESGLSRIKNRKFDITRKVLILLFLATYEEEEEYEEEEDFYEKSADEVFEELYLTVNSMLKSCGFATLDPRSPFDWMVIFCMCVEDLWEIDSNISDFLQCLFVKDGNEVQE